MRYRHCRNIRGNRERPIGLSLRDHYESFNTVIIEGSNRIFGATKRANATFIIVGLDVATVIESMDNFVSAGVTNVIGPHVCGTLRGLKVIKNPYYPPRSYVLGFKGMTLFDAGLKGYMISSDKVELDDRTSYIRYSSYVARAA